MSQKRVYDEQGNVLPPDSKKNQQYEEAYNQGLEAVRGLPPYAPRNPYDDDDYPKYDGWEDGAAAAGLYEIYTNGILDKEYRR